MPWQETHPVDQRMKFVTAAASGLFTMAELCARYRVSRPTGYKWVERYASEGVDGLKDRSSAPRHCPHRLSAEVEEEIVKARGQFKQWGPRKLLAHLARTKPHLVLPAASTVGDLLLRRNLVEPRRRRRAVPGAAMPLQAEAANDVWSVDFKGEFLTRDGKYCYPLTTSDAHTRFLLGCEGLSSTRTTGALASMERTFREYGLPRAILSDNGVPFASTALRGLSRLSLWWLKLGIAHYRIEPGKPQQNSRHERMHRTLKACTTRPPERNLEAQQRRFDAFRQEYNEVRPHEALGQVPPATLYTPSLRLMPNVLPQPEYPGHFETRLVRHAGSFRFRGFDLFLSEVLAGEWIALDEVDDGVWGVYYFEHLLAKLDEREGKLYS